MKSNELMIGDWVRIWNYAPEIYTQEFVQISLDDFLSEHDRIGGFDEYEPIPLTSEILEKNGFKNKPTYSVYHSEDDRTEITIYYNSGVDIIKNNYLENEETFSLPFVCYVHELQHALRLCGLTELADNFKFE